MSDTEQIPFPLVGGGDCNLHFHSVDRAPTHDTLDRLSDLEVVVYKTTSYTMRVQDDFILMDASGSTRVVTLPYANRGKRVTIEKTAGANPVLVTVASASGNRINGATVAVTIATAYAPVRLKAVVLPTVGWVNG